MIQGNQLQKKLGKNILIGSVVGAVIFFVLLFSQASSFANATTQKTSIIGVWKLDIIEISKVPLEGGGYAVSFQFFHGFVIYWLLVLLISSLLAFSDGRLLHKQ